MPLFAGDKLGPYEILAPIGAGGMGEVYRARDTKLDREVAIKVLPAALAQDPERLARFEREAKVLASLNHPNIAQIYGIEDRALVMELVDGQTLQGPLPLDIALNYARQIADALEAAHEKNIIHRDLKPANIMITPAGVVKVLDFGLAAVAQSSDPSNPANSPTLTISPTRAGMILGTAGYMSPEQARGKTVDKRADIWAFGVVLFEMLTGKPLFEGETVSDTLAAVLTKQPDWEQVPAKVRRLLKKCLEKDPKKRLRDIGDAWELLEEPAATAPSRSRLGMVGWVAAVVATFIAAALAFVHFREQPPVAELSRFQILLPANLTLPGGFANQQVAPDGRKLGFAAAGADGKLRLWIRSFDSLDARPLPGIELANVFAPFFWSYDSRFIAFLTSDHKLKKVDVSGGPAQAICDAVYLVGGSWGRDGVILFAEGQQNGVKRVSQAGGTPITLTAVDYARQERGHLNPQMLPDGRHFLYYRDSTTPGNSGIYVGAVDAKSSEQSSKPLLVNDGFMAFYVASGSGSPADPSKGYLLFSREGTVLAQPFNPNKLELTGDPVPVDEQMGNFSGLVGYLSASTNGVLAYMGGNTLNAQLTWFDREGKNQGTVGDPEFFNTLALSRDGKQAAASRIDFGSVRNATLWLYDVERSGSPTRFTFGTFTHDYSVFSPDGSRIVFRSLRDGPGNLYQKLTNGAQDEEPLLKSNENKIPYSWSRDGNFLLYVVRTPKTKDDIWILPMDGSKKPMLFQATEFNETAPQFSPDGHWIAYDSDTSGRNEVYVREFSLGSDGRPEATAPHLISDGGGRLAHWRDDGKELSYLSPDGRTIMVVEIATKPVFQASHAKALFQIPGNADTAGLFDALVVTADGKRFLVAVPFRQSGPQQITVVLNWQAGLKK
jgi:Tol biopolymer transport system component/predicted Ser/Thr protein kinase